MRTSQIPVVREGYPYIAYAALVTLVVTILGYDLISFLGLFITGFLLYFFRDPERIAPDDDDVLVAPADGKVILIEKIFDEKYTKEHVCKLSIFMSVFDVHVNRMPMPAKVERLVYTPGSFLAANSDKGGLENESCGVVCLTNANKRFAVVQVAGLVARRIVCWAGSGDVLQRGERFGIICFGSRVDLYLPPQIQLEVRVGQRVNAGETVLGYMP